jgi:macrolide-specific efflux system membrane fusion protein
MKNWLIAGTALLILGIGGYQIAQHQKQNRRASRNAQTLTVQRGSIEDTVEATGVVQPLNRVEIKPPIAGRVEKLLVEEGARVKAGQILGWMSSTDRAAILDAARAKGEDELKHWEDAYKATPVVAPLSGTIILKNVVVGQTVDATTILFAMSDKLIVKADVDETDIGRIRLGMEARVTLDSYPTQPIPGSVFQILHEGVNVSNVITYPVKIEPKDVPPFFRSQMTANISLIWKKKDNVLLVPAAAISAAGGGEKQVMIPGPDGKPQARAVEVGLETGDSVEIVSGLQEGEKILLTSKRYTPQQAANSSPLIMSGPRRNQTDSGGATRRRQ